MRGYTGGGRSGLVYQTGITVYMTLELAFFSSPYANFVTTCGCISVLLRNDSVPWDGGTNADVFPQLLSEHSTCRHQVQVALASWQPRALRLPTARLLPPWWGPAQRPVQRGEGAHLPQRDVAVAGRVSRPGSRAEPGGTACLFSSVIHSPCAPGWPVCPGCERPGSAARRPVMKVCHRHFLQGATCHLVSPSHRNF